MLTFSFDFIKGLFGKTKSNPIPEDIKDNTAEPLQAKALEGPDGASVDVALKFTLKNEGGFTNHPDDRGGPTNYGIIQSEYSVFLGRKASVDDVRKMPLSHAIAIYRQKYWAPLNLDKVIHQNVATCIFDMGVLCGTGKSAEWVQKVLGLKVDRKIGPVTLKAINETDPALFVELFSDYAAQYFKDIVTNRPSQKVFLKGWLARADRLRGLSKASKPADASPALDSEVGAGLIELAQKFGVPVAAVEKLIAFQKKDRPEKNPRFWAVVDFTQHSAKPRFHLMDRVNNTVKSFPVSHGSGSDKDHNGYAERFSNEPGSECSSLGIYRCGELYTGKHGSSMRLDGKEPTNSNARSRAVVAHSASYVEDSYIKQNGRAGRSQGCFATSVANNKLVTSSLNSGSLIIAWKG